METAPNRHDRYETISKIPQWMVIILLHHVVCRVQILIGVKPGYSAIVQPATRAFGRADLPEVRLAYYAVEQTGYDDSGENEDQDKR
jgi:hypothetical protein